MRGEGAGQQTGATASTACKGGSTADWGQNRRGAHVEHLAHVCDAGRVEAQRLVERPRALPRVERRAYGVVHTQNNGRREAAGDRGASSRARLRIGGRARGGAHLEHAGHGFDAGGVEAQRLVERPRALPRVARRAYGAGRGCGPADGGDGVHSVQGRLDCRLGTEQAWSAHGTCRPCL